MRLVGQAKSGDVNAFVNLYDAYVERVYRYIDFLAPNTRVAEGLTFQVFFKAWENLDRYQIVNSSFVVWLYSIAQDQIIVYYRTHKKAVDPDDDFTMAVRGGDFKKEFQVIRNGLHFLTTEQQQILVLKFIVGMSNRLIGRVITRPTGDVGILLLQGLQALTGYLKETELRIEMKGFQGIFEEYLLKLSNGSSILDECWARYPEYSDQLVPLLETALLLNLGRDVKPLSAFTAYTHDALIQYIQSHPRRPKIIVAPALRRTALSFAMLAAVFLVTGTVQAQSALPGDAFYAWKRTSEQAWRALSPDPVATDIILAERRLNEWIALSNDSVRSTSARFNYFEALSRLKSTNDEEGLTRIVPALQLQQQTLEDAGLASTELDNYLIDAVAGGLPTTVPIQDVPTEAVSTAVPVSASTHGEPTQAEDPIEIVPIETEVPTEIVPIETEDPTEIAPIETEDPTEIAPIETEDPTEVAPIETEVPVPAETAPIETEVPDEIVPPAAPTPPPPAEAPQTEEIP